MSTSHDKYGNEVLKINGKWSIVRPELGLAFARRYDEGNYEIDNIHFAMMQEIESLREQLGKANTCNNWSCEPS